ncbi:MAG: hypothetical protein RL199_1855, partial [Pseudomonadota bacterium]
VEVDPLASDGSVRWHYDASIGAAGAVVFTPGNEPGPNRAVEVTYPVPCAVSR